MKVVSLQLPSGPSMERLPLPFSPTELLWRYPLPWAPPPPSPLGDAKAQLPAGLPPEPRLWTREDVSVFLKWCEREFDLPNFDMDLFQMNGKALCLLTKTDLGERCPGAGDVLHNVLQMLVRDAALLGRVPSSPVTPTARAAPYPPSPHSHPPTPTWAVDSFHHFHSAAAAAAQQPNSVTLSPAPSVDSSGSPQRGDAVNYAPNYAPSMPATTQAASSGSNHSDSDEEPQFAPQPRSPKETPLTNSAPQPHPAPQHSHYRAQHREFFPNDMPESNTNGRLLWDFLQQLLNDPSQRYTNYIAWKNRDTGVFKIVDPAGLAKLWGIQKNHLSMNYDKMSRALRYYYRVNILRKVQGERHCYQFLRNPTELKNIKNISLLRQQMSPTRVVPQAVVKTEMKEERCEEEPIDEDMPTDLSMAASEPWRKRARPDPAPAPPPHDKHHISALIGENMMMKRESEYNDHYALNLKSEKCEQ